MAYLGANRFIIYYQRWAIRFQDRTRVTVFSNFDKSITLYKKCCSIFGGERRRTVNFHSRTIVFNIVCCRAACIDRGGHGLPPRPEDRASRPQAGEYLGWWRVRLPHTTVSAGYSYSFHQSAHSHFPARNLILWRQSLPDTLRQQVKRKRQKESKYKKKANEKVT